ncbi:hypothetical protein JCM6882_006231 [Rhodosporidiobolus microsporus]
MPSSTGNMCLYFLAIFIPPVPVAMKMGSPSVGCADVLINIALCVLGWIPGVIHAWWKLGQSERDPRPVVVGGPGRRVY